MKRTHLTQCDYFDRNQCRSCSLLALPANQRTHHKSQKLETLVHETLSFAVPTKPLWEPKGIFPSRNKVKVSVSGTMKAPIIGLVDRSLQSTELLDCPLHLPQLNELLHFLKKIIPEYKLAPYHIERKQGELKGFILKSNETGSEVILRFVLRSNDALSKVKRAAREIQKSFPFVKVISANIQPLPAALLEGPEEILLTEAGHVWEQFAGVKLAFQPQSFSQVTHETAQALYAFVAQTIRENSIHSMLDLFCGVGGFSLLAASSLECGHGVELSSQAIESAKLACTENKFRNLTFECADVEQYLKAYKGPVPDAVLFNPPRRGLSLTMIEQVKAMAPKWVLYSSCNPETLLRDIKLFGTQYKVNTLAPFDMFPLTEHLEVVALLEKTSF